MRTIGGPANSSARPFPLTVDGSAAYPPVDRAGDRSLCGAALGLAGAVALALVMRRLLFGVSPLDPMNFLAAGLVLFGVALGASYIPARRAASTDPVNAARAE